ncbi:MAG: hypothetical protein WCP55_20040 [Lentisphaerota bacterium]
MLRKALSMSVLVLAALIPVQVFAGPPPVVISELKPYATFSYLCMEKNPSDVLDFIDDIWVNNESTLVRVRFSSINNGGVDELTGISATVHDKKNNTCIYKTKEEAEAVPAIRNLYSSPHWWGVIGFAGITTREIVFTMLDNDTNQMLLVSYTMNKRTNELVRNHTVTIPIVNVSGVTTKLSKAWSYTSSIYYVVSSTDNGTGETLESYIFVYDSKLTRLLKQRKNSNGDLTYGERGGNNSMFPMPSGYIFDDHNETDAVSGAITRFINVYRQP